MNITFWMSGSTRTPSYLTMGIKPDGLQYQATRFLNLNNYGTVVNSGWITVSTVIPYTPDPFQVCHFAYFFKYFAELNK